MGLDMYLKGNRYVHFVDSDDAVSNKIAEQFPELAGLDIPVSYVTVEVGYWRKANAIHKWFVNNVQRGVDDCGNYYVSRDHLNELQQLCERVLAFRHLAVEQLPTANGFFFGSTEYDEYYFNDVEKTLDIINRALTLPTQWSFEYHSSW